MKPTKLFMGNVCVCVYLELMVETNSKNSISINTNVQNLCGNSSFLTTFFYFPKNYVLYFMSFCRVFNWYRQKVQDGNPLNMKNNSSSNQSTHFSFSLTQFCVSSKLQRQKRISIPLFALPSSFQLRYI